MKNKTTRPTVPLPKPATILKHCRCIDCRCWLPAPYSMCRHGIICNGVQDVPDYPADAWHYCALYRGPQISRDVWVWPKGDHVGPCAKDAEPASQPSPAADIGHGGERVATT